jgi:hypothetical protein
MQKHPISGRFLPDPVAVNAHAPVVIGNVAPVSAPIPHGPLSAPGNLDDYSRAELVKIAARRSTEQGGTLQQRLEEAAKERGFSVDQTFNPLAGI